MASINFEQLKERSLKIRQRYHELELNHHGSEWTVEEDALAFLTDAGLVGRHVMSQQGRWPKENTEKELKHKIGESIWWLAILAERMNINIEEATEEFLSKTENLFEK
ncbi:MULTISPECIES: MazG-like protein [unclassified Flavobacterium]|jgi:NTP pyrophosphatase (non-canonical NTP hydrolase)|uniref:MazG-like protein n=1 Tax=unclassified Flavobacterium TaxID=196869 RepID=UPI0012A9E865|nr:MULTISPECIES: MazG-like protein [unclassified Flavobacterium]MBF4485869.1 MazG-like protein [Flavobacterium sp. CSZ]QGK76733.1 MazG-like protein [Flavobacterium sp. SLB02]